MITLEKYIAGSDLTYMQNVGHILLHMVDVKPDEAGAVEVYHMFGDDYGSVNQNGLKYDPILVWSRWWLTGMISSYEG